MRGAVFFISKYGSTAQYANWISQETGLPLRGVKDTSPVPSDCDFLVVVSPVICQKLLIEGWVRRNLAHMASKPVIMVTVSGAPAGPRLDAWIRDSLPPELVSRMHHVALRGRQNPRVLSWFDRAMLIIGALKNADPVARKEELGGFDFVDKSNIGTVVKLVRALHRTSSVIPLRTGVTKC
ncbi:flavodoxin domain-containing protein [uncultured Roseovarius sp.]|uniref:flavodoxin domain-containing protein n=1 Tax=uncultured Roseovarius sp. TaxID=293344 RepID=UPI00345C3716